MKRRRITRTVPYYRRPSFLRARELGRSNVSRMRASRSSRPDAARSIQRVYRGHMARQRRRDERRELEEWYRMYDPFISSYDYNMSTPLFDDVDYNGFGY
jgi:hypothetical protein